MIACFAEKEFLAHKRHCQWRRQGHRFMSSQARDRLYGVCRKGFSSSRLVTGIAYHLGPRTHSSQRPYAQLQFGNVSRNLKHGLYDELPKPVLAITDEPLLCTENATDS